MKMWLALSISGLAWVISLYLAAFIGYKYDRIKAKLTEVEKGLKRRVEKEEPKPESTSSFFDPDDLVTRVQWEQDEVTRKLNQ